MITGTNPTHVIMDEIGITTTPNCVSLDAPGGLHIVTPDNPEVFVPEAGNEIHKMLCLSTAHICGDTAKLLQDGEQNAQLPVFFQKDEYGWFVHVSNDNVEEDRDNYSEDMNAVLDYARARGCTWIMLDQDGPVVDGLKTYEW